MKWYKSIEFKIILSVAITAIVVNGLFAYLNLTIQEKHLNETILRTGVQLSETIEKSIKFDMLENRKQHAYRIMETIGEQEGIERIRVYSPGGEIIFSTDKKEIGNVVDKKSPACMACHAEDKPLDVLARTAGSRIFASETGKRILGMINPLYNQKECSTAECHFHPEPQKVLGVIDIAMSLDTVDKVLESARNQVISSNIMSVIAISTIIVLILLASIGKPVKELVLGTMKVADGKLDHVIPVTSDDEMGHLARSFNHMTENLRKANEEIQGWIKNLESKVEERTSELKQAQHQLFQSEKMVALGKMAATVAHEINNPLHGIYTYIKLMERKLNSGASGPEEIRKYREYLGTMGREVERTSAIVGNLLDLTRPKEPVRQPVDMTTIIEESLLLLGNQFKIHNVRVEKKMDHMPDIQADPEQMKQVILNLMINACEAMEGGGTLVIRSAHDKDTNTAILEFQDTGVGIPVEDRPKIFDPFFTTKEKGTGLGLSVVSGIISRHDGHIDVESEPGKGTLMRIVLPVG